VCIDVLYGDVLSRRRFVEETFCMFAEIIDLFFFFSFHMTLFRLAFLYGFVFAEIFGDESVILWPAVSMTTSTKGQRCQ
jgi:hypothetical protein